MSPQNGTKMKITIGAAVFKATMYDNATATAFKSLLPLTVNMIELNGNEKYVDLPLNLPMNAANPVFNIVIYIYIYRTDSYKQDLIFLS